METFKIHSTYMDTLNTKIDKMNRRAVKLDCEQVKLTIERTEIENNEDGTVEVFHIVSVSGSAPKYNGWRLVAVLENTENGNIIHSIPNEDIPAEFRYADVKCDHCHASRYRKDTFLVYSDTEGYKQVGRSCLKDFLGHRSPESIVSYLEFMSEIRDTLNESEESRDYESLPREERKIDLLTYLEYVSMVIMDKGWVSRKEAIEMYKTSTSDLALNEMFPMYGKPAEPPTKASELASASLGWVNSLSGEDLNDYMYNITTIAKNGYITFRQAGLAASIVAAYQRETLRKLEEERVKDSRYIGEVGDKICLELTVSDIRFYGGNYGLVTIIVFSDSEGNLFVWKTSTGREITKGDIYEVIGTVKEHNEYRGVKQTVLTRCKLSQLRQQTA